jgi:DNA-binding beta-propeller fold protein YncE
MRRSILATAFVALAVVASACGSGADTRVSIDSHRARPELLYLGGNRGITALAPVRGHVRFEQAGAVPSRDWSVLYTTSDDGTTTTVRTLDPATGRVLSERKLAGVFTVRTVSEDGAMVALTPPAPAGTDTYHPTPKDPSPLVILRRGDAEPHVLSVPGNVEPEAFSLSGDALFVIDFVPPLAPERYRVARLDLSRGAVDDVRSTEKELQEPMRGTARAQAVAPDGQRLYTLYERDATGNAPAEAFVHVLDLVSETATCVDLPPEFATDPLGAVAVTPSGARLFVYAPTAGEVAELDTRTLDVSRTAHLPAPVGAAPSVVRATATESTLYVSFADHFTSMTLGDFTASDWRPAPGDVIGIEPATDESALYVVLADRVLVTDPRTFATTREVDLPPSSIPVDHVAPALPPIAPGYTKCAC